MGLKGKKDFGRWKYQGRTFQDEGSPLADTRRRRESTGITGKSQVTWGSRPGAHGDHKQPRAWSRSMEKVREALRLPGRMDCVLWAVGSHQRVLKRGVTYI